MTYLGGLQEDDVHADCRETISGLNKKAEQLTSEVAELKTALEKAKVGDREACCNQGSSRTGIPCFK